MSLSVNSPMAFWMLLLFSSNFFTVISFLSVCRGLRAAAHELDGEEDSENGRLLWSLPWHPAQFHEGHTGCEHQLRGV